MWSKNLQIIEDFMSTPVWNPYFVHAGCMPENIVACAKTKIDMKALDILAPTSNSREKSLSLDVTSMLSYA